MQGDRNLRMIRPLLILAAAQSMFCGTIVTTKLCLRTGFFPSFRNKGTMSIVKQSAIRTNGRLSISQPNRFSPERRCRALDRNNRNWCAVYTKAHSENLAEVALRQRGIVTFYPKLALPESAKRKRQLVALFPNYLFVSLDLSSNEPGFVTWCPGVKRLLNFDGAPAIIDDSAVSFLMDQATPDATITACSNLRAGQEVIIEHGPFEGLVGIIETAAQCARPSQSAPSAPQSTDKSRCSCSVHKSRMDDPPKLAARPSAKGTPTGSFVGRTVHSEKRPR